MKCTFSDCNENATRVMAYLAQGVRCMFVAPYCDDHAAMVAEYKGGTPAGGPALSPEAKAIEGVR